MSFVENGGVRAKVSGPATGLLVTGIINIVVEILGLIANVAGIGLGVAQMQQQGGMQPQGGPVNPAYMAMFQGTAAIVGAIIGVVVGIIIIIGATRMKNLQTYGLALASSILAMIPCISPCCLLGLPIGIWAVVVLSNPEVKQAFRS